MQVAKNQRRLQFKLKMLHPSASHVRPYPAFVMNSHQSPPNHTSSQQNLKFIGENVSYVEEIRLLREKLTLIRKKSMQLQEENNHLCKLKTVHESQTQEMKQFQLQLEEKDRYIESMKQRQNQLLDFVRDRDLQLCKWQEFANANLPPDFEIRTWTAARSEPSMPSLGLALFEDLFHESL